MAEYWKSTPKYWCKFCQIYVRDTGLERKNHEASGKHQNNIQRGLRELHKEKSREDRDRQRAKDEVARLNGLVGGSKDSKQSSSSSADPKILGVKNVGSSTAPPQLNAAAQRKAHAEQLAAMGVELPEEMKRDVMGVGGWQAISEKVVEEKDTLGRSLADIVKEENESKEDVKNGGALSRGVHKRKLEEDREEEAAASRRKIWGNTLKTYPGRDVQGGGEEDLDALLSGLVQRTPAVQVKTEDAGAIKKEESPEETDKLASVPDIDAPATDVKQEGGDADVVVPVVFKKRKSKK